MQKNWKERVDWPLWLARLWTLPAIYFVGAEILFPHAGPEPIAWQDGVLLALIFAAVGGLILAWKWTRTGGLLAMGAYLAHLLFWPLLRGGWAPTWWLLGLFVGAPGLALWWLASRRSEG